MKSANAIKHKPIDSTIQRIAEVCEKKYGKVAVFVIGVAARLAISGQINFVLPKAHKIVLIWYIYTVTDIILCLCI